MPYFPTLCVALIATINCSPTLTKFLDISPTRLFFAGCSMHSLIRPIPFWQKSQSRCMSSTKLILVTEFSRAKITLSTSDELSSRVEYKMMLSMFTFCTLCEEIKLRLWSLDISLSTSSKYLYTKDLKP